MRNHAKLVYSLAAAFGLFSCVGLPTAELKASAELRRKASQFPIEPYAGDQLQLAEKNFVSGSNAYSNHHAQSAKALDAAFVGFEKALAIGLPRYFSDHQRVAYSNWRRADEIFASVCMSNRYQNAQTLYQGAQQAFNQALVGLVPEASNSASGFYPRSERPRSAKARALFDQAQAARREALLAAAQQITVAEHEFSLVMKEARIKKERAENLIDRVLKREREAERRGAETASRANP
ncbi:MAG: hypothetical protein J0L75_04485 [Spirochaetes bacterium]|nr:hypothetical protein [Spirochaetota bacterium]